VLRSYSWYKTIKIVHNLKTIEGRLYKFKMAAITSATWPTSGCRSGILIMQLCRASLKSCIGGKFSTVNKDLTHFPPFFSFQVRLDGLDSN
jgi:hypothetical protein